MLLIAAKHTSSYVWRVRVQSLATYVCDVIMPRKNLPSSTHGCCFFILEKNQILFTIIPTVIITITGTISLKVELGQSAWQQRVAAVPFILLCQCFVVCCQRDRTHRSRGSSCLVSIWAVAAATPDSPVFLFVVVLCTCAKKKVELSVNVVDAGSPLLLLPSPPPPLTVTSECLALVTSLYALGMTSRRPPVGN